MISWESRLNKEQPNFFLSEFMKISVTLPLLVHAAKFPDCAEQGFLIKSDIPILSLDDVSNYLEEGVTGAVFGNKFTVLSAEACTRVCSRVESCDWWSVTNGTLCALYNNNGLATVAGTRVDGGDMVGHKSCSLSIWPDCLSRDTFVSNAGYSELWFNATAILGLPRGHPSCYNSDCHLTDKFKVESVAACATVCSRYPGCAHFSFGSHNGTNECLLRRSQFRNYTLPGYVSGDSSCASDSPYVWPVSLTDYYSD